MRFARRPYLIFPYIISFFSCLEIGMPLMIDFFIMSWSDRFSLPSSEEEESLPELKSEVKLWSFGFCLGYGPSDSGSMTLSLVNLSKLLSSFFCMFLIT